MDPSGFDAGKRIKGKKRHVLVDTQGLLMEATVHAADIQDRDGGVMLMAILFGLETNQHTDGSFCRSRL
ncbi:transposase [Komagataeibacter medellinensis]|uniref:transposase n=1 Tax=Komagataeibacter medellinensis TaxID=1177712 RepID=UPI002B1FFD26|nr:transposase [Komagataeibacter medellinensis]